MFSVHHSNSSGPGPGLGPTPGGPLAPLSNQSQGVATVAAVSHRGNLTTGGPAVAGLSMTLGVLFNIVALVILGNAYANLRRHSKATFLLFASSLVVTDLAGHVIPGTLVLRLYLSGGVPAPYGPADALCQFLGGSMVFFGLCPLFLGCAMAVERCLGVTRPLLHASLVTTTRTKLCLSSIWLLALGVALLPCFRLGVYTYQFPGTWCFIKVLEDTGQTDVAFVLLFSGLGLACLATALVCNTVSGVTLVLARRRRRSCTHRSAKSHDIEMVVQLVGIMVTSCICWSPLLQLHRGGPGDLQDPDGDGRPSGLLEPDPGPLGLHPAPPGRAAEDLPHHRAPRGPEGEHLPALGGQLLPELGQERRQQGLRMGRSPEEDRGKKRGGKGRHLSPLFYEVYPRAKRATSPFATRRLPLFSSFSLIQRHWPKQEEPVLSCCFAQNIG
ncbi:prostaglandin E receptor 1a (subtype EP1) isoform X1 [Anguilla anguilla]|uniref:prostaglandin E receptor 1a (subtype EP1) isoform X1 n=1 Tax=Anguilla anguilla TaxID=7936 RepID=UPI0015AAC942|nr:prostaglandin E receptor 1a (subtype EP1) isoform X1 [Anguilla anguilla]